MNLDEKAESPPLHDRTNEDLQNLIHSIRRRSGEVAEREVYNKAAQLLQDRGVTVNTLLGVSIFAEA